MPIGTKHCRNDIWKVLYKNVSFHFIQTKNISATGNSCFWLANLQKNIFFSETTSPNDVLDGMNTILEVLYTNSFWQKMSAIGILFYWLAEILNNFFFSETISPTYLLLGTNHFCEVLSLLFLCCVYFLFCFFVFLKKIV